MIYRIDINDHLWFAQYRNTVKKDNGCIINLKKGVKESGKKKPDI